MNKIKQRRLVLGGLYSMGIAGMWLAFFGWNPFAWLSTVSGAENHDIVYQLVWEWGTAQPLEQGWQTTNELGYEIVVTNGYMVSRSVELIECVNEGVFHGLLPQIAYAGHGTTEHDPSRIGVPYVESLAHPTYNELEIVSAPVATYCDAHYLLAPGIETANNMPATPDMQDITLWLTGSYLAPSSSAAMPFTIQTNLSWGSKNALLNEAEHPQPVVLDKPITVTLQRRLDSLFAGIDFVQMTTQEIEMGVLRSLTQNTQVFVTY